MHLNKVVINEQASASTRKTNSGIKNKVFHKVLQKPAMRNQQPSIIKETQKKSKLLTIAKWLWKLDLNKLVDKTEQVKNVLTETKSKTEK